MEENQNKTQVKYVLLLLVVIVIALVGILIYLLIKPRLNPDQINKDEDITSVRQEETNVEDAGTSDTILQDELTQEGDTTGDTTQTQDSDTTADDVLYYKSELDKDINSLDSLDLSSPEDDYSEAKIDDL